MIFRTKNMGECARCPHRKHARACKRDGCECAYRSKPRKPIRARNVVRRPPAKATAQREAVLERAVSHGEPRCEFLQKQWDYIHPFIWARCRETRDLQTCHVFRRRLCGDAIYHPDVAIAGCPKHHKQYDHRSNLDALRVPEDALARAVAAIKGVEAEREANLRAAVHLPGESA